MGEPKVLPMWHMAAVYVMRQTRVQLDLHTHWRAPGQASGVKVRLAAARMPMAVKIAMRSLHAQTRIAWGGPYSQKPPAMRVVWGWPLADDWHRIGVYSGLADSDPRTRMRWTVSKRALRLQMGHETLPCSKWNGVLSCDPDEETPMRIVLHARPQLYVPRQPLRVRPTAPGPNDPFPEIVLP